MTRVLIIQESVPDYRVPFFDGLRSRLAHDGVELSLNHTSDSTVRSARGDAGHLAWAQAEPARRVAVGHRYLLWQPVLGDAMSADLVILEYSAKMLHIYALLALRWSRVLRARVAFWGHGRNMQEHRRSRLAEELKRRGLLLADWWFPYTAEGASYLALQGFPMERVSTVNNAIDTTAIARDVSLSAVEPTGAACLYIGALYGDKRLDFLFRAADELFRQLPGFSLSIAGDGELRAYVASEATRRSYVRYLGRAAGKAKVQALAGASVVLMPGLVGLGVLDAFAAGRPVVAVDLPYHSPEFSYLEDNENAIVLPRDATPEEYAAAVVTLLRDPQRLRRLAVGAAQTASTYSLENMIDNFTQGILAALHIGAPDLRRRDLT